MRSGHVNCGQALSWFCASPFKDWAQGIGRNTDEGGLRFDADIHSPNRCELPRWPAYRNDGGAIAHPQNGAGPIVKEDNVTGTKPVGWREPWQAKV